MKQFPDKTSGLIPGDPYGRTYAELDRWYRLQGTSLYQQCCKLLGDPVLTKKRMLLERARTGAKRPAKGALDPNERTLGSALVSYTHNRVHDGKAFDSVFNEEIRRARPDWFGTDVKKQELLALAKAGTKRPRARHSTERHLAYALCSYTRVDSPSYDCTFDEEIRWRRPSWFFRERHRIRKAKLLAAARSNASKPLRTSILGRALYEYTSRHRKYDADFDEEIRRLQPGWFPQSAQRNAA